MRYGTKFSLGPLMRNIEAENTDRFPAAYVRFQEVVSSTPSPTQVEVSNSVELETLHISGPEPALVFIHGGLGSLWNPYPQIDAFAGNREMVTYSLAGNGNSSTRPEQFIDGHVADLQNLLDALDVEQPIIHGHSYGTAIAIEYAKQHPTSGLVLHGGGDHDLTPKWEKPFLRLFLALRLYKLPANKALMRWLAHRVGAHKSTPESVIEDFLQSNPMPHRRSAWTTVTKALWGYDGRDDIDLVTSPTLVIHGPADGIVSINVPRKTANRISDSLFYRVERTGHIAMIERPAIYNNLLRALITTVREDRPLQETVTANRED